MYKLTDMPYLAQYKPEVLKDRILAAYIENAGRLPQVFEALGITAFTYYKYVRMLGLQAQLTSMREAFYPGKKFSGRRYSDEKPKSTKPPDISTSADAGEISGVWSV